MPRRLAEEVIARLPHSTRFPLNPVSVDKAPDGGREETKARRAARQKRAQKATEEAKGNKPNEALRRKAGKVRSVP